MSCIGHRLTGRTGPPQLGRRRQPGKENKDCKGKTTIRNAGGGGTGGVRSEERQTLVSAQQSIFASLVKGVPLRDRAEPGPACWIAHGNRRIVAARGAAQTQQQTSSNVRSTDLTG